ncbi:DUF6882 domain-containing protein [Lysinibacter cavernae]|uniref:Uncharacterized protein n=1 Tax=Lysinibacter cavernae TaxID=1640652 RepID=A0A7X5QYK1_9MICO|nr:DUF6882 domain-containing protein [Lysinibacter cavernae]NIH52351.1 hypothetical protein [Lysinibacter cavernae]
MAHQAPTLNDLVDDAIFLSAEYQSTVQQRWGSSDWRVDTTVPEFVFFGSNKQSFRPHLIGSVAAAGQPWRWGWDRTFLFPASMLATAKGVRTQGKIFGISALNSRDAAASTASDQALRNTLAAKTLSGQYIHVVATAAHGTSLWMLLDSSGVELAEPTTDSITLALGHGIATTTVTDATRALNAYAKRRGVAITWPQPSIAELRASNGTVVVALDDHGHIRSVVTAAPIERVEAQHQGTTPPTGPARAENLGQPSSAAADAAASSVQNVSRSEAPAPQPSTVESPAAAPSQAGASPTRPANPPAAEAARQPRSMPTLSHLAPAQPVIQPGSASASEEARGKGFFGRLFGK